MTSLTLEPTLQLLRRLAFPSVYGEHFASNAFACSGTRRVHESQSHKDLDSDFGYSPIETCHYAPWHKTIGYRGTRSGLYRVGF
jgi:hypothetical protein